MSASKRNILIIGAGAAGLSAALKLADEFQVTIVEARNRIGGRIHAVQDAGFSNSVELGAEFIHGNLTATLALVEKYHLEIIPTAGIPTRMENGKLIPADFYFDHWDEFVIQLKKLNQDIPVAEFLLTYFKDEKFDGLRNSIRRYAEGYDAADTRFASTFALRDEWLNERDETQYRLRQGYGHLLSCMAEEIKMKGGRIILNAEATDIRWKKNNVELKCRGGERFSAEKLIMTLPVGLMQQNTIKFSPEVPALSDAFQTLGFGHVIKILIEFDTSFWQAFLMKAGIEHAGFIFSEEMIPTWWTQYPSTRPLLTGWLAGPSAFILKNKTDDELFEYTVQSLAGIFGISQEEIRLKINAFKIVNWTAEPFSGGGYSYATAGAHDARNIIMQGIDQTIWFAGEAIYEGPEMGTVEAALASGNRIAEKLCSD